MRTLLVAPRTHSIRIPKPLKKKTRRLPTNHFDIVYSKNAIDHAYNAPQVLREMVAVVKPGGVVVILVSFLLPRAQPNRPMASNPLLYDAAPLA